MRGVDGKVHTTVTESLASLEGFSLTSVHCGEATSDSAVTGAFVSECVPASHLSVTGGASCEEVVGRLATKHHLSSLFAA